MTLGLNVNSSVYTQNNSAQYLKREGPPVATTLSTLAAWQIIPEKNEFLEKGLERKTWKLRETQKQIKKLVKR